MVLEGDLTWGAEHTIHCTDDVLQNGTPETYTILLTNVTPMNSIREKTFDLVHSVSRLVFQKIICA